MTTTESTTLESAGDVAAALEAGAANGSAQETTEEMPSLDSALELLNVRSEVKVLVTMVDSDVFYKLTGDQRNDAANQALSHSVYHLHDSVEKLSDSDGEPESALVDVEQDVDVLLVLVNSFFTGNVLEHRAVSRTAFRLQDATRVLRRSMFPRSDEPVPA